MKEKSKSEGSIIGGADGPTSIFIAGRTRKKPLKVRIRNIIYRYRRKIVEKKVVADSHTLDELVQYAMNTYNLIETNSTERKYIEQQKNLKESLILQHKPEVLGEMKDIPKPDVVLLALLYLGVKHIRLGPTLPGFLSPNVAKVLVENFNIKATGEVQADIDAMMAGK